jgi:hypothetical protein
MYIASKLQEVRLKLTYSACRTANKLREFFAQ